MDLIRANAHLGAKTEPHTIRHSRACVPENASRIHAGLELICYFWGGSQNRVGVL